MKYYHGSPKVGLSVLFPSDEFALLGKGVYFYKNKTSALRYGENLYAVNISPQQTKLLDNKTYSMSDDEVSGIFRYIGLKEFADRPDYWRSDLPVGIRKYLWWCTEGGNYTGVSQRVIADFLRSMFLRQEYAGIIAEYPNGGEVLCLWRETRVKLVESKMLTSQTLPEYRQYLPYALSGVSKETTLELLEDPEIKEVLMKATGGRLSLLKVDDDGYVNVDGDVDFEHVPITKIPVPFGRVLRYFDCGGHGILTLENAPKFVGGSFYCSDNKLQTLEGAPTSVGGSFYCEYNDLRSLEGAPTSVGGDFYCSHNQLRSLEGAPTSVGGDFYCSGNPDLPLEEIERYRASGAVKRDIRLEHSEFQAQGEPLIEKFNVLDLKKGADEKNKNRSKNIVSKLISLSRDGVLTFKSSSETLGRPEYWVQHIQLLDWDDVLALRGLNYFDRANLVVFGNLKVECACPWFLYGGYRYIHTQLDTVYGSKEHRKPKIKNPREEGVGCKHLLNVLGILPMSVTRVASLMKLLADRGEIKVQNEKEAPKSKETKAKETKPEKKAAPEDRVQEEPRGRLGQKPEIKPEPETPKKPEVPVGRMKEPEAEKPVEEPIARKAEPKKPEGHFPPGKQVSTHFSK